MSKTNQTIYPRRPGDAVEVKKPVRTGWHLEPVANHATRKAFA